MKIVELSGGVGMFTSSSTWEGDLEVSRDSGIIRADALRGEYAALMGLP